MTAVTIDVAEARRVLTRVAPDVTALIRSIADLGAPTRGLEWTTGQTAAHLVAMMREFTGYAKGDIPEVDVDGLPALNARLLAEVDAGDARSLADQFAAATAEFLTATQGDGGRPYPFYGGRTIDVASGVCLVLGELLIHGHDLASSTARSFTVDRRAAVLALSGTMAVLPAYLDRRRAGDVEASYELRIRTGPSVVIRVARGELTVEAPDGRPVDCRISADPVAFLLVGYGRIGQWKPIALGQLVAWGRRPWVALRFQSLLLRP